MDLHKSQSFTKTPFKLPRGQGKRGGTCPVCQRKDNCLISDRLDWAICWKHSRNRGEWVSTPVGWRYVKEAKHNMGGFHVLVLQGVGNQLKVGKDLFPTYPQRVPSQRKKQRKDSKKSPNFPKLEDSEISRAYRLIAAQKGIHKKDRERLQLRGLQPWQIEDWASKGFYSHVKNQLVSGVSHPLPGLSSDLSRTVGSTGLFIPAQRANGKIVGGQIWARQGSAKYLYLKGGCQVRKENNRKGRESAPLQTVAFPSVRKNAPKYQQAHLNLQATSPRKGQGTSNAIASLTDSLGVEVARTSKEFQREDHPGSHYQALILGLQLALEVGVGNLEILGLGGILKHFQGESSHGHHYPHACYPVRSQLQLLHKIALYLLDKQGQYHLYSESPSLGAGKDTHPGERYFDTKEVWLTEGLLKPWLTASFWNRIVIGTVGGTHASAIDFEPNLKTLDPEIMRFLPDAGAVENRSQVPFVTKESLEVVQNLGYPLEIGWWGQQSKPRNDQEKLVKGDIDEISLDTEIQWISPQEFWQKHPKATQKALFGEPFKPGLKKVDSPVSHPRPHQPKLQPFRFFREDYSRKELVQQFLSQGHKFIFDASPTGSGKTHDFREWVPEDFGASLLLHVTEDVFLDDAQDGWSGYRGRDRGRVRRAEDERIVKAEKDTPKEDLYKPSNCERMDLVDFLYAHNETPSEKGEPCATCPFESTCQKEPGWYQHDRAQALKNRKIRLHPQALDEELIRDKRGKQWVKLKDKSQAESGTVIIADDVSPFIQQISIDAREVNAFLAKYSYRLEEDAPSLRAILCKLRELLEVSGDRTVYHSEITSHLPEFRDSVEEIQDLFELQQREIMQAWMSGEGKKEASPKWLGQFLEALQDGGFFHVYQGTLNITTKNQRFIRALNSQGVRAVIFADATGDSRYLARWLGLDSEIPAIAEEIPEQNKAHVRIQQLTGLGDLGHSRSYRQQEAVAQLKESLELLYPEYGTIDLKKSKGRANQLQLNWHSSSRGSNAAKAKAGLLLIGTPRPNLASVVAEYTLLTGKEPNLEEQISSYPMRWQNTDSHWCKNVRESKDTAFSEYYYQRTLNEIEQGIGRLRGNRRAGEELEVLVVNEFPLDRDCEVFDIWDWLESRVENRSVEVPKGCSSLAALSDREIEQAARACYLNSGKIRQSDVAELLGASQPLIAKYFAQPGKCWKSFKEEIAASSDRGEVSQQEESTEEIQQGDCVEVQHQSGKYRGKAVVLRRDGDNCLIEFADGSLSSIPIPLGLMRKVEVNFKKSLTNKDWLGYSNNRA
jgi:hypothetical protein